MTRHRRVSVLVPATTSNLGPGFDVLGLALGLYNELDVDVLDSKGPDWIEIHGEGAETLPRDRRNLVLRLLRERLPKPLRGNRLRLSMINRIPLARGLGSSAAARLSAVLAAQALAGKLDRDAALAEATRLEGHPDNVAPALHGGLCMATGHGDELRVVKLGVPSSLRAVVCVPAFELSTAKARAVLPARVPREDAVTTSGRLVFLLHSIQHRDFGALGWAMDDVLHQPYRRRLVPRMQRVIDAAKRAGAFGASLSGAGPSIFAFAPKQRQAAVGRAMARAFGRGSRSLAIEIDSEGAKVGFR